MILLHHLNGSPSWRVVWLLEELGISYELKRYERDRRTRRAPAELRAVHPLGETPIIRDDMVLLAGAGPVAEYVVERYGSGRLAPPRGRPERWRYAHWLHFAETSGMLPVHLNRAFSLVPREAVPLLAKPFAQSIARKAKAIFVGTLMVDVLDYLERELERSAWFAGDEFTAADIQLSYAVEMFAAWGAVDATRPRLRAFIDRSRERPAYQRVVEVAGPLVPLS